MGKIVGMFVMPHPPIMVREVGGAETQKVRKSIEAAEEAAVRIKKLAPDTIVIISPHGPMFSDVITIDGEKQLSGSLKNFRAPGVVVDCENDLELANNIIKETDRLDIPCLPMSVNMKDSYDIEKGMDHGAVVPLYFVQKVFPDFKLVHITYSMMSNDVHYRFGMAVRAAVEQMERNVVLIASGDLSHRLTKTAPSGYNPKGAVFDTDYVTYLKDGNVEALINMPRDLREAAGECGYRSTLIMLGCLDGMKVRSEILSYEGPFGVGYCIAQVFGEASKEAGHILEHFLSSEKKQMEKMRQGEDPYVRLARMTLENHISGSSDIKTVADMPAEMENQRAGVFVSIKKNGELRGCIGTIAPTKKNIREEIIQNAVSSGTRDPRFMPVEPEELPELVYSVDVLSPSEPIASMDELDVERYGVIVRKGNRSGLLLPNLEGVDTVEQQVDIALRKAGIGNHEDYAMERFEVIRHK